MDFDYRRVDVFICMECQALRGRKEGLSYKIGQHVPLCKCDKVHPVLMVYIDSMPQTTFAARKERAEERQIRHNRQSASRLVHQHRQLTQM